MTYEQDVLRTAVPLSNEVAGRASENIILLHAAMGVATEAGEFVDALKKSIFYGKPLDRANIAEELGDLLWYLTLACIELGITEDQIKEMNVRKLRKRYPDKFCEKAAEDRSFAEERAIIVEAFERR